MKIFKTEYVQDMAFLFREINIPGYLSCIHTCMYDKEINIFGEKNMYKNENMILKSTVFNVYYTYMRNKYNKHELEIKYDTKTNCHFLYI